MIHGLALILLLCINRPYRRLLERETISVGYVQVPVMARFGSSNTTTLVNHIRVISPWKYKIITNHFVTSSPSPIISI